MKLSNLKTARRVRRGVTLVDYVMIAIVIILVCIPLLSFISSSVVETFESVPGAQPEAVLESGTLFAAQSVLLIAV